MMLATLAPMHMGYAPTLAATTPVVMRGAIGRANAPVMSNLQQRVQTAALGAALAASVGVNAAAAAGVRLAADQLPAALPADWAEHPGVARRPRRHGHGRPRRPRRCRPGQVEDPDGAADRRD